MCACEDLVVAPPPPQALHSDHTISAILDQSVLRSLELFIILLFLIIFLKCKV